MYDLAIVGNGSIANMTALEIKKKFPKTKICIIGNKERKYSASNSRSNDCKFFQNLKMTQEKIYMNNFY